MGKAHEEMEDRNLYETVAKTNQCKFYKLIPLYQVLRTDCACKNLDECLVLLNGTLRQMGHMGHSILVSRLGMNYNC